MEARRSVWYFIIALLILLVAAIITGMVMRKKTYHRIDEYEEWKISIMNRPVTSQMSQVKKLNLTGETETKFETWRSEWDDIVTKELPEVEEKLFEAEKAADRYRFDRAKQVLVRIQKLLQHAERRVDDMVKDLREFIANEERDRQDVMTIKTRYHDLKKQFLAHRTSFQDVIQPIEDMLNQVDEQIQQYEEQTEGGNYSDARQSLQTARDYLDSLEAKQDAVPQLLHELQHVLPKDIKALQDGIEGMRDEGYILDHLHLSDALQTLNQQIDEQMAVLETAEIQAPKTVVENMHDDLESIYDQLEYEVASKKTVESERPLVEEQLTAMAQNIKDLQDETQTVQMSYHVAEEDLEKQTQLEDTFQKASKQAEDAFAMMDEQRQGFGPLRETFANIQATMDQLDEERFAYEESLHALREDELRAKEAVRDMQKQLAETRRLLQKSNIPGVPYYHEASVTSAEEKIADVDEQLSKKPLDIAMINRVKEQARQEVEENLQETKTLIEDAALSERLIQYGNRYRTRYQDVAAQLNDAELSFRDYNYQEALEIAARAIQQVEPHILQEFQVSESTETSL